MAAPPRALPPGTARNLARGKPLPPGIAKRILPPDLLARLPRYDGYEYCMIGSDIVLAAIATGIILDILTN
ncbi:anti-virulence regulator CigR family protein [Inquilinus limosus]|uniref:anti-virulence regulator CigR family protein n=1 Tax=Inquilinus limosus TaxID=171674 RepID=UPI003F5CE533